MKRARHIAAIAVGAAIILFVIATTAFNLWLPIGVHVGIAATRLVSREPAEYVPPFDLFVFRPVSRLFVALSPDKCNAPYFRDGQRIPGRNERIAFVVTYFADKRFDQRVMSDFLDEALKHCHPDAPLDNPTDWSPLMSAIALKHKPLVITLLQHHADPLRRAIKPGKATNGMNALELARFLEAKSKDADSRRAFGEIATHIEPYIAARAD